MLIIDVYWYVWYKKGAPLIQKLYYFFYAIVEFLVLKNPR